MKSNKFIKTISNFIENILTENSYKNISPEKAKEKREIAEIINICYRDWEYYRF